jgi:hypothetical protein
MSAGGSGASFQDPPMALGTSPLEYEFRLKESDRRFSGRGVSVEVARRFTEGLIRVERDGIVAERRVRFTGKPITVDLVLRSP